MQAGSRSNDEQHRGSGAHFRAAGERSAGARFDQAVLVPEHDRLDPVAQPQLVQDVTQMGLHGALRHGQSFGDLDVGPAADETGRARRDEMAGAPGNGAGRAGQARAGSLVVPYPAAKLNMISTNNANVITWTLVHHRQMAPILNSSA